MVGDRLAPDAITAPKFQLDISLAFKYPAPVKCGSLLYAMRKYPMINDSYAINNQVLWEIQIAWIYVLTMNRI